MPPIRPRADHRLLAFGLFLMVSALACQGPVSSARTPSATGPSPTPASSSPLPKIAGGINAEPSMRPWRYRGPNPDGWWCVPPNCYQNSNPMVTIDNELELAARLGVANVRLEFPWPLIEPHRGVFDWSRADAIVSAAGRNGVQLQPVLVFSPDWAAKDPTQSPTPDDFSSFVKVIVGRYHGSIRYWEMWNEPDHPHYWNAGETAYVRDIVIPGYEAAKAADPEAQVILAGQSVWKGAWFDGVFSNGGGSHFDIVAYHDYRFLQVQTAYQISAAELAHGREWPIWLGEYGAQEASTKDTTQQELMTSVLTSPAPIAVAQWYNLRDDFAMSCCPPKVAVAAHWGVVMHDDSTMKDGFATMQALLGRNP